MNVVSAPLDTNHGYYETPTKSCCSDKVIDFKGPFVGWWRINLPVGVESPST